MAKCARKRAARLPAIAVLAGMMAALAYPSTATAKGPIVSEIRQRTASNPEIAAFYASRQYRPIWIHGSALGPEADIFLKLLLTAEADGRDPDHFLQLGVREAIQSARSGSPEALAHAETILSHAFVSYVRDLRRPAEIGIVYGEASLKNPVPANLAILRRAASAPSFRDYLEQMGWMHPIYAGLRSVLAQSPGDAGALRANQEQRVRLNLERARVLPAHEHRYILVDAAAARLFYYEGGKVRASMRVVVGTPDQETPMMVGMIRYATLNPYWHVPTDLTRKRIAPRVLSEGLTYFHERGYEVISEWSRSARVIDPATIDWKAVAGGRKEILVRQRPGPRNGMGKVKFQFPNELGIYLHDTPSKQLFREEQRGFSAGCVRLEDANGLGRLLMGREPRSTTSEPEQTISLANPVPVYITYLTAVAENGRIVQRRDIYDRDSSVEFAASASSAEAGLR